MAFLKALDRFLGRASNMDGDKQTRRVVTNLNAPMLHLGDKEYFSLADAYEHVMVMGGTGSGKTSGALKKFLGAYLKAGMGGLVCTVKSDDTTRIIEMAYDAGRADDLMVVNPQTGWLYNFIDWELSRPGAGGGLVDNAVALLMEAIENRSAGGQRQDSDSFWTEGARRLIRFSMETLLAARERVSMRGIKDVIDGMPIWDDTTRKAEYPAESYLEACLEWARGNGADVRHLESYWLREMARKGSEKTTSGIISTFTNMADPLLYGVVAELFVTEQEMNFSPMSALRGRIVVLDLPVSEYGEVGRTAQLIFKKAFIDEALRRQGLREGERPCFFVCDEYQFLSTASDLELFQAGRSSCIAALCLTQNLPNLYASFDARRGQHEAHALMANFQTHIYCRNGDKITNEYASETIGRGVVRRASGSFTGGTSTGESRNIGGSSGSSSSAQGASWNSGRNWGRSRTTGASESVTSGWSEQEAYQVMPSVFTKLASGGAQCNYKVQAVLFKAGKRFASTGQPYMGVTFDQR